jgi:hypothetical protein
VRKLGSNLGPFTAENRIKPWSETQNQAKRINNIGYWSLLRDQGVGDPLSLRPILINDLHCRSVEKVYRPEAVAAARLTTYIN